jgi:hypothetical protein
MTGDHQYMTSLPASRFSPFAVVGARFDFMHLPGGAVFGFSISDRVSRFVLKTWGMRSGM